MYNFLDLLLKRDDLVLETLVKLFLMFDGASLGFESLEYFACFAASIMCLNERNAANDLSKANAGKPAANMRLYFGRVHVQHGQFAILSSQIATTQRLINKKSVNKTY